MLYILVLYIICLAQQYFLEYVSLCVILIALLVNTKVDAKSWCYDQLLTFQLRWLIGYTGIPAGTDVCFTATTFLAFNLVVCMGFFVVLHSRNAAFLYLFCVIPAAQMAMSSAPKIHLTEFSVVAYPLTSNFNLNFYVSSFGSGNRHELK